jgi:TolB-like protein
MKKLRFVAIAAVAALFLQGCSAKKEVEVKQVEVKEDKKVLTNSKYYSVNTSTTTTLEDTVNEVANQLFKTMKIKPNVEAIAVTSFVDLHQLNKTTHFGRVMAESFFNELHSRGLTVADFRGQKTLIVNGDGEFFLSRDIKKLSSAVTTKYVLVGTYSRIQEGVIINARVIDNQTGIVMASSRVVHHSISCEIFENCDKKVKTEEVVVKTEQAQPVEKIKRTIGLSTDGCSTVSCPKNCITLDCNEGLNKRYMNKSTKNKKEMSKKENNKVCNYK